MAPEYPCQPWTDDQVKSLNEYQASDYFHPFTCGRKSHTLVARNDGWYCPECETEGFSYNQDWCHKWMANWEWQKHSSDLEKLYSNPRVQQLLAPRLDIKENE